MAAKKNALGRGLGALMEDAVTVGTEAGQINEINLDKIDLNPFQPRQEFNDEAIKELASSIKEIGIIQPISVRKIEDDRYQLITGERRYRAAKLAGLNSLPTYVREADDQGMLEMALIENLQREDLNSIEVAMSLQRLIEECHLTQENLSERVGKKRSTITNYLRLLKLPPEIQLGIKNKRISMGHARALININDNDTQNMIFEQIMKYDFSVRKVEEVVRQLDDKQKTKPQNKQKKENLSEEYVKLRNHLTKHFQTSVEFKRDNKGKGKIVIPFSSDDELERIIAILDKINH